MTLQSFSDVTGSLDILLTNKGMCLSSPRSCATLLITTCSDLRVDKFETGFLLWTPTVKGYQAVPAGPSAFIWEEPSRPILQAMSEVMNKDNFFTALALLWGQESMKNSTTPELRAENVTFMKSIGRQLRSGLSFRC